MNRILHRVHTDIQSARRSLTALLLFLMILLPGVGLGQTPINSLDGLNSMTEDGNYILTADIEDASEYSTKASFSGTLEAGINSTTKMPYRIKKLGKPLFSTLSGTVKNLVLEINLKMKFENRRIMPLFFKKSQKKPKMMKKC